MRDRRYGKVWRKVFKRDNYICVICFSKEDLCVDHLIPISKKGKSVIENMRILCRSCNTKEGHKSRNLDLKLEQRRNLARSWSKDHPGYFTQKTKEFLKNHPGYWNKYSKRYEILLRQARLINQI